MAMMAGRVLLVCALCVLWCGVSGIAADGVGGGGVVASGGDNKKLEEPEISSPVIPGVQPQAPEVEESPTRRSEDVLEETYEVVVEGDEADRRGVGVDGEKGNTVQKGRGEGESEGDSATEAELHSTDDEILRRPSPNGAKGGEKTIPPNDTPPEEKVRQQQEDPPILLQSDPGDLASGKGVPPESTEHEPPASGNPSSETETTGIQKVPTPTHVRESPTVTEKDVVSTEHEREDKEGSGSNPIKVTDVRLPEPQELRSQSLDGTQRVETGVSPISSLPEDQNKRRVLLNLSQGESANVPPETTQQSSSTGGHRVENSRTNDDDAKNNEGSAAGENKDKKGLEKDVVLTISEGKLQPPVTAAASTSETAINGDSKGSSTAATALRSDDDTQSNPTKDELSQPSSERTAELSTTSDSEDASDSAEKAAAQNAGIPTTKAIATAKTNDTVTPADGDGSTAVSHITSPLLLLLLVVACAAAAVVAA
ncbi:mucin-associated surface protein (MASP) [Trypanosoma cruzi Dm28c]|uniref:Mucin-associated surface protein (MASP) n=2 Tax=Trypanosoma cruzi TaxID=5693 RepID=V5A3C9_TRYCR|nr:mucin-associated surface protein (MASP) [Trypanosoma cruzi Dm28c]PBJ80173.1 mucin-associated surface protein [Trypanosoma cruzi cruzi]PWU95458.1 Mucin-associated surface protein (MASP) [Trypanosoma cruzi]